jgi:putative membrane protein
MTTLSTLMTSLPAHPGPWNGGYGWNPFFPFFGFLFFLLVVLLVVGTLGRRRAWGGPHRYSVDSAEADLARRFAAGDIDEKEYEQRLSTLRRLGQR